MPTIQHRVGIRGDASAVFAALVRPEGLVGWWATTASGEAGAGCELHVGFGGVVTLSFVVRELTSEARLVLACPDGPGPWKGSTLTFELEAAPDQVFVTLTHHSDSAADDDFLYFNTKWPVYLLSLRDYVETGAGRPSPRDTPIHVGDNVRSNTT